MVYNISEFYVNKFSCLTNPDKIEIDFIPSILKRRISLLDKVCISLLNKTCSPDIQNIIYSSQFGEVDRLLKIISQYSEFKEVSPNLFSASVHNYPVGFFLFNIKKPLPYSALSAADNTISSGLLAALISNYDNTLYCYCDVNNNQINAFALNISKKQKGKSRKYIIKLENNKKTDNFKDYIKLFNGEILSIKTPQYIIERAQND